MKRKTGHFADLERKAKAERAANKRMRDAAPEMARALLAARRTLQAPFDNAELDMIEAALKKAGVLGP